MPAGKTKYHSAKCTKCAQTPEKHTIRMENPHGFSFASAS